MARQAGFRNLKSTVFIIELGYLYGNLVYYPHRSEIVAWIGEENVEDEEKRREFTAMIAHEFGHVEQFSEGASIDTPEDVLEEDAWVRGTKYATMFEVESEYRELMEDYAFYRQED